MEEQEKKAVEEKLKINLRVVRVGFSGLRDYLWLIPLFCLGAANGVL